MSVSSSLLAPHTQELIDDVHDRFQTHFGAPEHVAVAPGRVNLIGEHTDYNDGFVLPIAIDRYVAAAFRAREDRRLRIHAGDFEATQEIDLDALHATPDGWGRYVAGVAWALQEAGEALRGADVVLRGNIPVGAGLSSSAALEMAVALALATVSGVAWQPVRMARLGQHAENSFVGVSCGIMDQFASATPDGGAALLLDCRSLAFEQVALPEGVRVVVMDTGVRRRLADGVYNERHRQCRDAVAVIRRRNGTVTALRDVPPDVLATYRADLDPVTYRRARHVVDEIQRPRQMARALEAGRMDQAGRLMYDSHASLRDLYEVSCDELDAMVEAAQNHPACYGARLTGAGLGGCAIALVERDGHEDFTRQVHAAYRSRFDHPSALYVCRPSAGAHLLEA